MASRRAGGKSRKRREGPAGPAGAILRACGKDGPQLIRSEGHRWTEQAEEIFLDCLAATNNATFAAEQCGFSREAIYARARRDSTFAERMAAARAQSWGRIDEGLNQAAEDFLAGRVPDPKSPFANMTIQDAIAIQKLNRSALTGEGRRPAWPARRRRLEEVHDSILKKFSAIARKRGLL